MQFETEEPTHGAFSSLGYTFENFVNMYSLILADTQGCTIDKAYARAFAQEDYKKQHWETDGEDACILFQDRNV